MRTRLLPCLVLAALSVLPAAVRADAIEDAALASFNASARPIRISRHIGAKLEVIDVCPSFLLIRDGDTLRQLVRVKVKSAAAGTAVLRMEAEGRRAERSFAVRAGSQDLATIAPATAAPGEMVVTALLDGSTQAILRLAWTPPRRITVYLTNISHFDWGYTGNYEEVRKTYDEVYNRVLDYAAKTRDWPADNRYRFTADAAYQVMMYLERNPGREAEIKRLVAEGGLEVNAKLAHLCSPTASEELLCRELYPALRDLAPRLGLTVETAIHTDIPGITWREIDVLRGAGVKYLLLQPNASYRGGGIVTRMDQPHAYWWKSPSGERILVWRTHMGYHEVLFFQKGLQGAAREFTGRLLEVAADTPFDFFHLTNSGEDGHCDNWPPHPMVMQTARDWDEKFAWPHIIMSTPRVFFERLEREQGDKLPEVTGDAPDWWAEGVLTEAYETGFSRKLHYILSDLEFFSALAPGFSYPTEAINQIWRANYFYDEHTWGYFNPLAAKHREIFGDKFGLMMKEFVPAQVGTVEAIGDLIREPAGAPEISGELGITVLNPTAHGSTVVARANAPLSRLFQTTGVIRDGNSRIAGQYDAERDEFTFLPRVVPFGMVHVSALPCCAGSSRSRVTAHSAGRLTLENEALRLSFDSRRGGLVSLKLLPSGREAIDPGTRYALGQPIERRRGRGANRGLEFTGIVTGLRVTEGPVFSRVSVSYQMPFRPGEKAEVSYTVYQGLPWVDVRCKLTNYHSGPGESRHLAFPFAAPGKISVEIPFGEMEPGTEQYGYAPFYAVNNWVMVRSPGYTVTWAPLEGQMIEVGAMTKEGNFQSPDIRKYDAPKPRSKPWIFSELMNNFQQTNYSISQKGTAEGNYRISFAAPDASVTEAAGPAYLLSRPPLVLQQASTAPAGPLFEISPPSARLVTLKRAEDGDGFIARVVEMEGIPVACRISFPGHAITAAILTDTVERNREPARVDAGAAVIDLPAYAIRHVRLKVGATP